MKKLLIALGALLLFTSFSALAGAPDVAPPPEPTPYTQFNFYMGASAGVSQTHDLATNLVNKVNQVGPGWSAFLGYQLWKYIALELGYVDYYHSRESAGPAVNAAQTEHFSVYLAAAVRFFIWSHLFVFGKLGVAYGYARRTGPGTLLGVGNSYNLFVGGGLGYLFAHNVSFFWQWTRDRGNNRTGTVDLFSVGLAFALTT